jgi:Na+/phosphate symporter
MRASVNLTVASILISFATSLKLPLSTTYVTFMVAMGTSFGDGAWGRESAVYRISGVTSVIGGWFLTAFAAFVAAFSFAVIIHYGGATAIAILITLAAVFIVKSHAFHKKKVEERIDEQEIEESKELIYTDVLKKSSDHIYKVLKVITTSYKEIITGLTVEDRKILKTINKEVTSLDKKVKKRKDKINNTINNLREEDIEAGYFYVQILDSLREMVRSLTFISTPAFEHIDNTHKGLIPEQVAEYEKVSSDVHSLFERILPLIQDHKVDEVDEIILMQQALLGYINDINKIQLKRIKHGVSGTKNGILYFGILTETKNLLLHTINLVKAKRDLILLDK